MVKVQPFSRPNFANKVFFSTTLPPPPPTETKRERYVKSGTDRQRTRETEREGYVKSGTDRERKRGSKRETERAHFLYTFFMDFRGDSFYH